MPSSPFPPTGDERTGCRWIWIAVLLLWLGVTLPLALQQRTLYLRDVFASHLHLKAFSAESLARFEIPALNPQWALGQPYRGNPNALPFYPGNLLFLLLPFWSAFNLHYALHWLLALIAMWRLAREMGQGPPAALLAGLTYAGSGWILSGLSFYNILTVSAWWPLVLLGGYRGGRRGVGLGGAACGLALLGGEPITALLGVLPLLVLAVSRHGWRRGFSTTISIGGLGLLVALPQVVATLRVLPFTARGLFSDAGSSLFSLVPPRLLELLLPLPFGWATFTGELSRRVLVGPAYVFTLYFGIVALLLVLAGARRHRALASLVLISLLLAWLGGPLAPWLGRLSGGLVRYPEKALFVFALGVPILAGWGLEAALGDRSRWGRVASLGALALLGFGVALAVLALLLPGTPPEGGVSAAHAWLAALQALLGGALLWATAWALRHDRPPLLLGLQLLALLQLGPLVATIDARPLRQPAEWAQRLGRGSSVATATLQSPFRDPVPPFELGERPLASLLYLGHELLEPPTGVLYGLSYPLAPDLEGLYSPLSKLVQLQLPRLDPAARVRWLGLLGARSLVADVDRPPPGLRADDRRRIGGVEIELLKVEEAAPVVWWPRETVYAADPEAAFGALATTADPVRRVVTSKPVEHSPNGFVRLEEATADRLVLEVGSDGGVLVVRRAFQPLFEASIDGRRLETLPVNVALLGIVVPPGRHRVLIEVSSGPIRLAGGVGGIAFLMALALALARPSESPSADGI